MVEISILTEPEELEWKKKPCELLEKVCIGKDGLIIKEKKGIYPSFRANRDNELFKVYKKMKSQSSLIKQVYRV